MARNDYSNKASLSLTETEIQDERVKHSVNEMLEEYVW